MLELEKISYADADSTHIYPTDLTLRAGEFSNLIGATLAGKTTLMRLMAGLEPPSAGRILFDGEDVTGHSARSRAVAMVYQQFINYPTMNVFDNIASPLRATGYASADIKKRVGEVAELVRISDLLERMPYEISGGQQQRTALARVLVRNAKLVLLDEPLVNLDYKLREELREELPRLFAERGCVTVYATTEPGEAMLMGGNTAALHQGQVVQFGRTTEMYHNPQTLLTARIFSNPPLNEMTVSVQDGVAFAKSAGVNIPLRPALASLVGDSACVAFRAHHLKLGASSEHGHLSLHGEIRLTEISGSESFLHVRVGDCEWVLQAHEIIACANDETVEMHIALDDLMVFDEAGNRLGAK